MPIRLLALALLLVSAQVDAATKHKAKAQPQTQATETPADNIDVDAMARAKDVGAQPASTDQPADANAAPAPVTPPADATPPANDMPQAATPPEAPAPASEPAPSEPVESAPAKPTAENATPPMERPSPLAPPLAPGDAEKRLAAACESRATDLLDAAQRADYASATKFFDAKMRSGMPQAKFKQAWESLAQFGKLQARGQSHRLKGEGYIAVTIPLIFDKANLYAQVACGSDGLIAGFYVKPLDVPKS